MLTTENVTMAAPVRQGVPTADAHTDRIVRTADHVHAPGHHRLRCHLRRPPESPTGLVPPSVAPSVLP